MRALVLENPLNREQADTIFQKPDKVSDIRGLRRGGKQVKVICLQNSCIRRKEGESITENIF
jgi:hypothetical protein